MSNTATNPTTEQDPRRKQQKRQLQTRQKTPSERDKTAYKQKIKPTYRREITERGTSTNKEHREREPKLATPLRNHKRDGEPIAPITQKNTEKQRMRPQCRSNMGPITIHIPTQAQNRN